MAHRTPVLRYCVIGVAGAAPIAFLTSTVFWLIAAFRPDRAPDAHPALQRPGVDHLHVRGARSSSRLCLFLASRSTSTSRTSRCSPGGSARFNVAIAVALVPAGFAGLTLERPVRLERVPVVLGQERRHRALDRRHGGRARSERMERDRDRGRGRRVKRPAWLDDPKRELWFAWYATVAFYSLYTVVFFLITRTQPPGKPWYDPDQVVRWFADRHTGPARRVRADLRPRRVLGDVHRVDHLLDPTDVGEPRVRVLLPDPLRDQPPSPGSCSSASR